MHPLTAQQIARADDAELRRAAARERAVRRALPARHPVRAAVGYRLVLLGWRLLDAELSAAAARRAPTAVRTPG